VLAHPRASPATRAQAEQLLRAVAGARRAQKHLERLRKVVGRRRMTPDDRLYEGLRRNAGLSAPPHPASDAARQAAVPGSARASCAADAQYPELRRQREPARLAQLDDGNDRAILV
jgi:hypothetical protein